MGSYWTTIAACVSAIAAVVALALSVRQIRLSNRQHLFDRRLSIWLTTKGLMELYGQNAGRLKKESKPQLAVDFVFSWLTNNSYLCEIGPAIKHALEPEYQLDFHKKLDEIRSLAASASYSFKGNPARAIEAFLTDYQALLFSIYQYQILLNQIEKNSNKFHWTLEEASSKLNEPDYREELYGHMDAIATSFDRLSQVKMVRKIERQLRLG